jgi:hypothetical protein
MAARWTKIRTNFMTGASRAQRPTPGGFDGKIGFKVRRILREVNFITSRADKMCLAAVVE